MTQNFQSIIAQNVYINVFGNHSEDAEKQTTPEENTQSTSQKHRENDYSPKKLPTNIKIKIWNPESEKRAYASANLDTGAAGNFISSKLAEKLGLTVEPQKNANYKDASGNRLKILGRANAVWQCSGGSKLFKMYFKVCKKLPRDVILGKPFLEREGVYLYNHQFSGTEDKEVLTLVSKKKSKAEREKMQKQLTEKEEEQAKQASREEQQQIQAQNYGSAGDSCSHNQSGNASGVIENGTVQAFQDANGRIVQYRYIDGNWYPA